MNSEEKKMKAAVKAAEFVENGMIIGLGTGSTVFYVLHELARKIREENIEIKGIPTSLATKELARELSIPLTTLQDNPVIDLTIDGADEVNPDLDLIKGAGGALLREKIVADNSKILIIIVDDSKMVDHLGDKMPLPVEVDPFGADTYMKKLKELGGKPKLRLRGEEPFVTDSGNHILDVEFLNLNLPSQLEKDINNISGIFENGLFLGMTDVVIVAYDERFDIMKKIER